jgi:hypothetical protein
MTERHYYVGKLFWIDGDLYQVNSIGEPNPETGLTAVNLDLVDVL